MTPSNFASISDYTTITVERDGGVDTLSLNRPDVLNAINTQMVTELRDYFFGLAENRTTRIVVMRGEGRAFCAGLDLGEHRTADTQPAGRGWGFQGYLAEVYVAMRRCPQPIVSLVQGAACGGGFAFVLASDIRIAADTARMNAAFIKIGLSACDMGVSYFLPRQVGASVASELMLTGRFLGAERALSLGLVSEVVSEDGLAAAGQSFVDDMLATSPMGLRLTKEGLNMAIDATGLDQAMAIENRNQILTSGTKDFREGMMAFLEKRPPIYQDK